MRLACSSSAAWACSLVSSNSAANSSTSRLLCLNLEDNCQSTNSLTVNKPASSVTWSKAAGAPDNSASNVTAASGDLLARLRRGQCVRQLRQLVADSSLSFDVLSHSVVLLLALLTELKLQCF